MATVTKRRGKWTLDYYDQHNKRRWEATDGNKKAAELLLAQRLQEIGKGEFQAKAEQTTFNELAESYLASLVTVRATTMKSYRGVIQLHVQPYFGARPIRNITLADIENFRAHLVGKIGVRTVNKSLTLLSMMLNHALRHRWISHNPALLAKKLKQQHAPVESRILTPQQIGALVANAGSPRLRTLILTAILTGLREGELLGLKWGDVDFEAHQISVRRTYTDGAFSEPKTKASRRRVDFPQDLAAALKRWKLECPLGELDLVFPNGAGKPENFSNLLRRGLYPALERAGLRKIRFHDLRNTFTSLAIRTGANIKEIQTALGHASAQITLDVYGHLYEKTTTEAADRMSALLGSKMVASDPSDLPEMPQVIDLNGGPCWTRTSDQRIMSPLL
jgi:integrase